MTTGPVSLDADDVERLIDFVRTCATDGYLNTRGTARLLLRDLELEARP